MSGCGCKSGLSNNYRAYYDDPNFETQLMGPSNAFNVPAPHNNYLGSYVPAKYMLPDCPASFIYHRGNSAIRAGDLGAWNSSARGLETDRLYPEGGPIGCYDNFKSFLIDPPRDVLAADRLDSDPDGVLSIRRGQSHDLRGDLPLGAGTQCGTGNCYSMDPNTATIGWKSYSPENIPWPVFQGTQTKNDFFITNKPVRSFIY
jgi:hypothetical protein